MKVDKAVEFVEFQAKGVCGKKSSTLCVIVFDGPEAYKPLLERFKNDPVTMTYASQPSVREMFGLPSSGVTALIYKPKRSKFYQMTSELTIDSLASFIDDSLSGSGSYQKGALTATKSKFKSTREMKKR